MRRKKASIVLFGVSVILLLVFSSFSVSFAGKGSETKPKILKIGVLEALTGFGSAAEKIHWEGFQVAEEWLNARGGITINGQKYLIKFVVEDNKGTGDGAVAAANKLVYEHNLKFSLGDLMPWTNAAAGTVTERAQVLRGVEYNVCTPAEYGPNTPYTFVLDLGTVEYMTGLYNYLQKAEPELKTTVIIHPDDGAGPYAVPIVKRLAEKRGYKILGDVISWPLDTVDFNPVIKKALARKPDFISLVNGWPAAMGAMLKAAREAGFTGPIICNHPCEEVGIVAGPAASNNYIGIGVVADSPDNTPIIKEMTPIFKKKYGRADFYHFMPFNCAYVLVRAIESAKSLDPTVVKDHMEKMKTFESIYGPAHFGGLKTYGINHTICHPVGIQTLMDNQIKHAAWVDITVP